MWYPPAKGWFMVNAKDLGIFGCFNRVRLLKVSKVFPRCGAVPPLAAKLPTNGRALKAVISLAGKQIRKGFDYMYTK